MEIIIENYKVLVDVNMENYDKLMWFCMGSVCTSGLIVLIILVYSVLTYL